MKSLFLSFMTILILSQSALAHPSSSVVDALHEFQYAMEVNWDQRDEAFRKAEEEKFAQKIHDLTLNGQDPRRLLSEVLDQVENDRFKVEVYQTLATQNLKNLEPEQISEFMLSIANRSQAQGASWSTLGTVAVSGAVVVAVTYIAFRIYMHEWGKRL